VTIKVMSSSKPKPGAREELAGILKALQQPMGQASLVSSAASSTKLSTARTLCWRLQNGTPGRIRPPLSRAGDGIRVVRTGH